MDRQHVRARAQVAASTPPVPDRPSSTSPTTPLLPAPLPLSTNDTSGPAPAAPGGPGVLRRYTDRTPPPAAPPEPLPIIRRARTKRTSKKHFSGGVRKHRRSKASRFDMTSGTRYATTDRTLTLSQRASGGFKPDAHTTSEDFRFRSNPTTVGVSSGYHEAAVTTDTFTFFRNADDQGDGTAELPSTANTAPLQALQGAIVDKSVLDFLLGAADGFRTDTALTILSAPDGEPAGHSGSGISQSGQSAAHDLVREACARILQDPETAKVTPQAVTVALGAYVVGSIAPGEVARLVSTDTLKAGPTAIATWEQRRNEAKARVEGLFATLSDDEKTYVQRHSQAFLTSADPTGGRHLGQNATPARKRATSLPRLETNHGTEVSGGKYDQTRAHEASTAPPLASASDVGVYVTQPFRLDRQ